MSWLEQQWYRHNLWTVLLLPLSWLFGLLTALRRLAYRTGLKRRQRLPIAVIVVGNISTGGTGKTPLVLWIAEELRKHGYHPGIISRGYGGTNTQPQEILASSNPFETGDEPVLLAKRSACPVWVGRDRVAAGLALHSAHPDCNVIISDDGLQHYALQRDYEIAVIDGQRGFGNGWLIPAGPLREPTSRLRQVNAIVTHGAITPPSRGFNMHLRGTTFRNLADSGKVATALDFAGLHLHAIAGIGNPQRYFEQLQRMGLTVAAHVFPDHHPYRAEDLQFTGADAILMTEKDAVKCMDFAQPHWWALEVNAEVNAGLLEGILKKLEES